MPIKSIDNRTVKGKAVVSRAIDTKASYIMDTKTRTVIIGYYRPEALSKILYL